MAEQRQPTEADWGRIAKRMGWNLVEHLHPVRIHVGTCKICSTKPSVLIVFPAEGERLFDPRHDYNDLARLIEAMQKAGYLLSRYAHTGGSSRHSAMFIQVDTGIATSTNSENTDSEATFWACVEALEAEVERPTIREALDNSHAAGGHAWDDVDNVAEMLGRDDVEAEEKS